MGTKLFHADGQIDIMKVIFTFCSYFVDASEMDDSWGVGMGRGEGGFHLLCGRYKRLVFIIDFCVAQPYSCAKVTFLDVYFINTL